jgi:LysR family transcriptional regulator, glycine cleavage system transcriptional activator
MRRLPPLNALKAFEAAARHVSFTKAANELCITHGAISRQVGLLEIWFGAPLFERFSSKLVLTDAGRALLADIGPVFDRIALCSSQLVQQVGQHVLSVNAPPTFTMRWLIPRLSKYRAMRPNVDVRITTSLDPFDFSRGEYDLAIRSTVESLPGFSSSCFMKEFIAVTCHPSVLQNNPVTAPMDILQHTLISYSLEPFRWKDWLLKMGLSEMRPAHSLDFDQMYSALHAVIEGLGIALLPDFMVADDIAAGRLCAPFGIDGAMLRSYRGYYPSSKSSIALLQDFCEWLCIEGAATRKICDDQRVI